MRERFVLLRLGIGERMGQYFPSRCMCAPSRMAATGYIRLWPVTSVNASRRNRNSGQVKSVTRLLWITRLTQSMLHADDGRLVSSREQKLAPSEVATTKKGRLFIFDHTTRAARTDFGGRMQV